MSTSKAFLENRELMLRIKEWMELNPQFVMLGVGVKDNARSLRSFPAVLIDSADTIPNNQNSRRINHVLNRVGHNCKGIYFMKKEDFELHKYTMSSKKFDQPALLQELINEETLITRTIQL